MMRIRIVALILSLVLLAPAAALAQDNSPFDGQLPPAQPTATETPEPAQGFQQDDSFGRETLWIIGGALLVFFVAIGYWISRDARRALPDSGRRADVPRDQGPHRHPRQAKAKARAKGRAQRQARKAGRSR